MTRTFTSGPARRVRTPLWIDVVGPSGSGKTLSSILLAEGIQRVQPGPIVVIDTESLRALKHANGNHDQFIHVPFAEPFGPLDYIAAFQHALTRNPSTIIVDSMTHEWEGPGGILEMHEAELDRMAGNDWQKRERCKMGAWIRPKAEHNRMKHFVLQQRCNWIMCFRAKEKIKPKKGGEPEDLGWQPLGAEDLIYEADLGALLYPGSDGRPRWQSKLQHEQAQMKVPGWFRALFAGDPQLTPEIGEQLARWAVGGDVTTAGKSAPPTLTERFDECRTLAEWVALDAEAESAWRKATPVQQEKNMAGRERMVAARDRARSRVEREPGRQNSSSSAPTPDELAEIVREEAKLA